MARRVKAFPEKVFNRAVYSWDKWLDGSLWELEKGKDFEIDIKHFQSHAHRQGTIGKFKVRTRIRGNFIYIQALLNND